MKSMNNVGKEALHLSPPISPASPSLHHQSQGKEVEGFSCRYIQTNKTTHSHGHAHQFHSLSHPFITTGIHPHRQSSLPSFISLPLPTSHTSELSFTIALSSLQVATYHNIGGEETNPIKPNYTLKPGK